MFEGGEELLLRDPRVGQSSKNTDLATCSFHYKALSFSGLETQLNSVQIFAHTHSRQRRTSPQSQHRGEHCMASRVYRPQPFCMILNFFAALLPFNLVDNTFANSNDFFKTLTTCSSFFLSVGRQTC
jgi:hypothetical protein